MSNRTMESDSGDDPCLGQAGRRAVSHGRDAKDAVGAILREREVRAERLVSVGPNRFGFMERADFALDGLPQFPDGLAIQVRAQYTRGTADTKLSALVESIRDSYPSPAVIVIDGDGWRTGIVDWARGQVDGRRLLGVFSLEEFGEWASSNL